MPSNGADGRRMDRGIPVKRFIVAVVMLLAGVGRVAAADMPLPQGAPVPPPIYRPAFYDWSGVYVGVNAGSVSAKPVGSISTARPATSIPTPL